MNPLILLKVLTYLDMGLRGGTLVFISQANSIQRYIEGGLASEMFLEVSRSFHMAMFYL